MKHTVSAAICFALLTLGSSAPAQPPAGELLQRAIYQEEAVGNLDDALKLYQRIVRDHERNEIVAAEAQLHIGLIHLKRGDQQKATAALQELADRYPGRKQLLRQARKQMPPVINEAMEQIRKHYVEEITDQDQLTVAALQGVVGNLDRYSSYIDPRALEDMMINTSGQLIGIGAALELADGKLLVRIPLIGSPAEAAGLKRGDQIKAIDRTALADIPEDARLQDAVTRIRGKAGEVVELEIASADSGETKNIQITRRPIKLISVTGTRRSENGKWTYHVPGKPEIGYLRIISLTKNTPEEFRRAIGTLRADGLKGLIIDLRNTGGGLLSSAIEVADMFLDDGVILEVRGRGNEDKTFEADQRQVLEGVPIVVLVNRVTASAAEILGGSLADRQRATVIGERTLGKGTVQALFPLQSGGAIKLTTARYYLPSGADLEKPIDPDENDSWGVNPTPEFTVKLSGQERKAFTEYRTSLDTTGQPPVAGADFLDHVLIKAINHVEAQ